MKTPGPDHPITITPYPKRVRVTVAGDVLADSSRALALAEASYPPVRYIPRDDASMERLTRTDRRTTCPYKGEASYYSIAVDGRTIDSAVWSYEEPHPAMEAIRGHLAFYPDKVRIEDL